jgi:HrpA-like RNA helicase
MLLEQGESEGKPTMIMVSQPRRIAVTALKRRLQEALGAKVGLRLGNGVSGTITYTLSFYSTCSSFSSSSIFSLFLPTNKMEEREETLVLCILFYYSSIQVREESSSTRLWFVTTGYLVALLAHHMESFSKYTHLVIDEVHERSADGDIICLLAKKVRLPS